ncbi:hypothetical protein [Methylobacterium sp. A54F]
MVCGHPRTGLLPQECAPADKRQAALTETYLRPALGGVQRSLADLRRSLDAGLAASVVVRRGKAYPLGCCHEITIAVLDALRAALAGSADPGLAALADFLAAGGEIRHIWGVLRERYFQNALQVGSLYVDVANDTVDPSKPSVEILPFGEAGFTALRGPEHFARIAAGYWGADTFANHALPELAPLLPMITCVPGQVPRLQSVTDYMTDLFRRDGFLSAETWLASAPPPPPAVAADLRGRWADAIGPARGYSQGRDEAVAACQAARAIGAHRDMAWRNARIAAYARAFGA